MGSTPLPPSSLLLLPPLERIEVADGVRRLHAVGSSPPLLNVPLPPPACRSCALKRRAACRGCMRWACCRRCLPCFCFRRSSESRRRAAQRGCTRRAYCTRRAAEAAAAAAVGRPRDAAIGRLRELGDDARAHRRRGGERGFREATTAAEAAAAAVLSAAPATPPSAACASLSMLPAPTAVEEAEEASGDLKRPLLLLRLPLRPLPWLPRPPTRRRCRSIARA